MTFMKMLAKWSVFLHAMIPVSEDSAGFQVLDEKSV
jgi:hypothetical protein